MNRPPYTHGASSSIAQRLADKQRELEHFTQLQQMSHSLVEELEALEQKLQNLADGTQAVALVLQNWGNIVRALTLASCKLKKNDFAGSHPPFMYIYCMRFG